jgi:predicted RNA-binding protein YlxR (DUF448 family)
VRTCVGCRRRGAPAELVRLTCDPVTAALVVGRSAPGRGAWVCGPACLATAARRGALARALRAAPDPASIERARRSLEGTFVSG